MLRIMSCCVMNRTCRKRDLTASKKSLNTYHDQILPKDHLLGGPKRPIIIWRIKDGKVGLEWCHWRRGQVGLRWKYNPGNYSRYCQREIKWMQFQISFIAIPPLFFFNPYLFISFYFIDGICIVYYIYYCSGWGRVKEDGQYFSLLPIIFFSDAFMEEDYSLEN